MNEIVGTCDCGSLEYKIKRDPINVAFCYCTACQLHTNSDKWYGIWVQKEHFELVKGTPSIFIRKGDSGKNMEHKFCAKCGVTIAIFVEIGNFYSVAATSVRSDNIPKPKMLIYTKSAANWALYPEGVPRYETLPPEMM